MPLQLWPLISHGRLLQRLKSEFPRGLSCLFVSSPKLLKRKSELSQCRAFHSQGKRQFPNTKQARYYHKLHRHTDSVVWQQSSQTQQRDDLTSDKDSGQFTTVLHLKHTTTWCLSSLHYTWHPSWHLGITELPSLSRVPPTSYDDNCICLLTTTAENCRAGTREQLQPPESPICSCRLTLSLKPQRSNYFVKTPECPLTWCVPFAAPTDVNL